MTITVGLKKIVKRVKKGEFGDKGPAVKEAVETYGKALEQATVKKCSALPLGAAHKRGG